MTAYPWTDLRLTQAWAAAQGGCDCAGCVDVVSLVAEVRRLRIAADERTRIITKALDEIDSALGVLLGLTRAEMEISGTVKWAWTALAAVDEDEEIGEALERQRQPENQPVSELTGGPCWHGDSRSCMCEE